MSIKPILKSQVTQCTKKQKYSEINLGEYTYRRRRTVIRLNIICVLGTDTEYIVTNLKKMYVSIEIDNAYNTLSECATDLKNLPVKVDKILINEDALGEDKTTGLIGFQTLINGQFFSAKEILFLMSPGSENIQYITHLFGDYHNVSVREQPVYNFQSIVYLLGGKDALEQKKIDLQYSELVRKKMGSKQTITLMAGEDYDKKTALVLDDFDQVTEMLSKLEAQQALIEIENKEITTEPIQPKLEPIEHLEGVPQQPLDTESREGTRDSKIIVMSGERGSGKTAMSYALAKSYGAEKKVLLIDLCMYNMGLSGLIEQLKENITTAFLHTLISKDRMSFENITGKALINQMMHPKTNISALTLSTETMSLIKSEEVLASIIEILISKLKKAYDIVIIDLPISKYSQYSFIFNSCDYLMLTFYRNVGSAVSLGSFLSETGLRSEWYKTVFIPTDAYNSIESIPLDDVIELKEYLEILMLHDVAIVQPIKLTGFNLGNELSIAIDSVLGTLPSKLDIKNHLEYLEQETTKVKKESNPVLEQNFSPFEPEETFEPEDLTSELPELEDLPELLPLEEVKHETNVSN